MMRKLMHNTLTAAAFAAFLLVGACASTNDAADVDMTSSSSETVQPNGAQVGLDADVNVHPERSAIDLSASNTVESTTLTSEEAIVDEANARGTLAGTSLSTGGTVIGKTTSSNSGTVASGTTSSSVDYSSSATNSGSSLNNSTTTTTTRTETVTVPSMTSSSSLDTQSSTTSATTDTDTDTTATTTRTRMRKD